MRKRPQALHRTEPISSRRHSGVVLVPQFWHTGCVDGVSKSLSIWKIRIRARASRRAPECPSRRQLSRTTYRSVLLATSSGSRRRSCVVHRVHNIRGSAKGKSQSCIDCQMRADRAARDSRKLGLLSRIRFPALIRINADAKEYMPQAQHFLHRTK